MRYIVQQGKLYLALQIQITCQDDKFVSRGSVYTNLFVMLTSLTVQRIQKIRKLEWKKIVEYSIHLEHSKIVRLELSYSINVGCEQWCFPL